MLFGIFSLVVVPSVYQALEDITFYIYLFILGISFGVAILLYQINRVENVMPKVISHCKHPVRLGGIPSIM